MASIGWDEAVPADTESIGLTDDRIRSIKTSLRQGLAEEHIWPSAGGDVGFHLRGSAKAYVGARSAVSSSGTDGKLMITSDTSQLFGVGSGGTSFIGGPTVITVGEFPGTAPQRHHWVEQFGTGITSSSGSTTITFPNSGYSGAPYVFLTGLNPTVGGVFATLRVSNVAAADGIVTAYDALSATFLSSVSFFWRSIGSRVL